MNCTLKVYHYVHCYIYEHSGNVKYIFLCKKDFPVIIYKLYNYN